MKQLGFDEAKAQGGLQRGDVVRVIPGPFENFNGRIEEVNMERGKLRVSISMFGRETPVELDFEQVEKTSSSG